MVRSVKILVEILLRMASNLRKSQKLRPAKYKHYIHVQYSLVSSRLFSNTIRQLIRYLCPCLSLLEPQAAVHMAHMHVHMFQKAYTLYTCIYRHTVPCSTAPVTDYLDNTCKRDCGFHGTCMYKYM